MFIITKTNLLMIFAVQSQSIDKVHYNRGQS